VQEKASFYSCDGLPLKIAPWEKAISRIPHLEYMLTILNLFPFPSFATHLCKLEIYFLGQTQSILYDNDR
jgi:hypothetical protein